jgi:hypothetical protein
VKQTAWPDDFLSGSFFTPPLLLIAAYRAGLSRRWHDLYVLALIICR